MYHCRNKQHFLLLVSLVKFCSVGLVCFQRLWWVCISGCVCAVQLILFSSPSFGFFLCLHVCLCTTIARSLRTPPFSFSLFLRHTLHRSPLLLSPSPSLSLPISVAVSGWASRRRTVHPAPCACGKQRCLFLRVCEGFFLSLCSRSHQSQENSYRGSQGA